MSARSFLRASIMVVVGASCRRSEVVLPGRAAHPVYHVEAQLPEGWVATPGLDCCLQARAIGLRKRITAKGMRRTFQDLTRAESVNDLVVRSISGHVTREMQDHYSTPLEVEQRDGIARVIRLADPKAQHPAAPPAAPAAATDTTNNPAPTSNSKAKG